VEVMRILLDHEQRAKWLYYETGFEQLHPVPEIHAWMEKQSYEYYKDWNCVKVFNDVYYLEFRDKETATMFLLKWS
jgi:hypothetical protein